MERPIVWNRCLEHLQTELTASDFNTWIRPLQAESGVEMLRLLAPNEYVCHQVDVNYMPRIREMVTQLSSAAMSVDIGIGGREYWTDADADAERIQELDAGFRFDTFVEGKSNEMAKAAAMQAAERAGQSYNPLLLYGGVGLGKTHLMQAVGHHILERKPNAKVVYLHSQQFVQQMVYALQEGTMRQFMSRYRAVDALLIDDIQFLANKMRSQEEFFHIFNAMMESRRQIVMTCDRYPKEIEGLEPRLKSRFVWGLTVAVEPPELETRVAILMKKAEAEEVPVSSEVAFYIAERVQSNVRELEGALKRVMAHAKFLCEPITIAVVRQALRDLLAIHERQVSIDNIQRKVADYYKIRVSDLMSKRRSRSIARPRQVAMALAKELTNHSLPEIGDAFGGRDHTTVIHACRTIADLKERLPELREDYRNLARLLIS